MLGLINKFLGFVPKSLARSSLPFKLDRLWVLKFLSGNWGNWIVDGLSFYLFLTFYGLNGLVDTNWTYTYGVYFNFVCFFDLFLSDKAIGLYWNGLCMHHFLSCLKSPGSFSIWVSAFASSIGCEVFVIVVHLTFARGVSWALLLESRLLSLRPRPRSFHSLLFFHCHYISKLTITLINNWSYANNCSLCVLKGCFNNGVTLVSVYFYWGILSFFVYSESLFFYVINSNTILLQKLRMKKLVLYSAPTLLSSNINRLEIRLLSKMILIVVLMPFHLTYEAFRLLLWYTAFTAAFFWGLPSLLLKRLWSVRLLPVVFKSRLLPLSLFLLFLQKLKMSFLVKVFSHFHFLSFFEMLG